MHVDRISMELSILYFKGVASQNVWTSRQMLVLIFVTSKVV